MKKLIQRAIQTPIRTLLLFSVSLSFLGCGGGDDTKPDTAVSTPKIGKGDSKASAASDADDVASDKAARKIYGVPLDVYKDVYFDNPLQVASTQGSTAAPTTESPMPPDNGQTTPSAGDTASKTGTDANTTGTDKPAASATGAVAWDQVISVEMLNAELKSIRNQFSQKLTTLGSYNTSTLELPVLGMSMAVMSEIARQHPGDIRWKENAKFIRVLSVKIADITGSAQAKGSKSHGEVNAAFLKICDVLDGNALAEPPEAEDEAAFGDFADMGYLMKRLKLAMDWMQNNTGSEDSFKTNADNALREVSVISVLGHVFSVDSFGFAEDDPVFANHAKSMRDNAKKMSEALTGKNFSEYDSLRSKVDQTCSACHMGYRTG